MGARARVKSACPGYAGRENEGFLSALFCPRYVGLISDSLIQISHVRGPDILLVSCNSRQCSFPFDYQHLSRTVTVAQRCLSLHAAFLLSLAWRDLTRRLRFKRFIRSREVRTESAQPGFINKRIDRLAEKRMVCGWSR